MARISAETRAAVLDDIRSKKLARNVIAKKHGISEGSVTNIARENGLANAFDRSGTESATRARVADMAAARAQLAADLLDDAQRLRARAWEPYQVVANTKDGPTVVDLDAPPLRDVQAAYTALAIAADKSAMLVKQDTDPNSGSAVDGWLDHMLDRGKDGES